ncbi:MAG: hypothetical protein Q9169_001526 [Polycauliona sp. 2 TL-2023]
MTIESVIETPSKKRRLDNVHLSGDPTYDSDNDSGDNLFDGYHTVDTLLLSRVSPSRQLSKSPTPHHVTQPTQLLNKLTPSSSGSRQQSWVQVAASSPLSKQSAPTPSTKPHRPASTLANRMAPPGTAFRHPIGPSRHVPIVDVSSDEDDRRINSAVSSDEESQVCRNADIKPSKFVQTQHNDGRSADVSRLKEITSRAFYQPLPPRDKSTSGSLFNPDRYREGTASSIAAKRSADVMADAYGNASRAPRPRQTAPAKAQPQADITLDDIEDFQVRTKVKRMQEMLPQKTIAACKAALLGKRGNYDDAVEYLSAVDDKPAAVDLTLSDDEGLPAKPTAKQQVKVSNKSIHSKWTSTQAFNQREVESRSSPPPNLPTPKPRKRLVQGRKKLVPEPPIVSRPPSPDILDHAELVDTDSQNDSAIGSSTDETELDEKILDFLNTCTIDQLSDIAAVPEAVASIILPYRPFKTLNAIREISGESKTNTNKRNAKRPIGDKIVDSCIDMWRGYNAVDGLVQKCESLGRPLAEQMKYWGVDLYGATSNGELDLTSFDQNPDAEVSVKDSGLGTPTSTTLSADEDGDAAIPANQAGNTIFGQPLLMSNNVVLKDYQIVGVNWLSLLFENKLSCILADDMGLGKTCQVVAFLAHLFEKGEKGPHLIIVPGSTIENWLREFSIFCPKLSIIPYYAGQAERADIRYQIEQNLANINVIVTTYTVAKTKDDCKFLRRLPLQVCVYDEGHQLKNRKSKVYEQLTRFKYSFRLLLTGTPLQNNLSELVSLLAFIMPQVFSEHSEDLDIIFSHKAKTSDDSHAALLSQQRIMRAKSMMAPFILRRKKHQVLKYLPLKTRRVEYCDLSPTQLGIYDSEKARGLRVIADRAAGKKVGKETANIMMALRKASIHPLLFRRVYNDKILKKMARDCLKEDEFRESDYDLCLEDLSYSMDYELQLFCKKYPATMDKYRLKNNEWMDSGKVTKLSGFLRKFKENGDRVLVFSQFVMVMDILEDVMETLGMRFFRLDGSTKIDERQDMIDQFYADPEITVFLLSTKAGGAGINLACANKVVIFDSSFNPQDDIQAENRAHRVGQTREVEVIRLVSKGTIEEQIYALGQTKLALDHRVAGQGEATLMAIEDEKAAEQQGQKMVEAMMLDQMEDGLAAK